MSLYVLTLAWHQVGGQRAGADQVRAADARPRARRLRALHPRRARPGGARALYMPHQQAAEGDDRRGMRVD